MSIDPAALIFFGGAAGLLTLLRPRVGILLPLIIHSAYLLRGQLLGIPTTVLEVVLLSVLLGLLLSFRFSLLRSFLDILKAHPTRSFLIGAFVLAATVSAVVSPHPETSWGVWKAMVIEPILYALAILAVRKHEEREHTKVSLHGFSPNIVIGLLIGGWVSGGASVLAGGITEDFSRLRGIYDVPNSLALVLAPLTALACAYAVAGERTTLRLFAQISLVLFVPLLVWTQSFGGILAASLGAMWVLWRYKRRAILIPLAGFLIAMVLLGATGRIEHALAPNSPRTARLQIWAVSWELIKDHPFLGTGLGTFEPAYQAKAHELLAQCGGNSSGFMPVLCSGLLEWVVRDPHNLILSFWLHTGLVGLLAMAGLLVLAFRSLRTFSPTPFHAALLVLLIVGLVDVPYWKNDLALLWWVFLLLQAARVNGRDEVLTLQGKP